MFTQAHLGEPVCQKSGVFEERSLIPGHGVNLVPVEKGPGN